MLEGTEELGITRDTNEVRGVDDGVAVDARSGCGAGHCNTTRKCVVFVEQRGSVSGVALGVEVDGLPCDVADRSIGVIDYEADTLVIALDYRV